jgi:arylsulfatase A-like enzyme
MKRARLPNSPDRNDARALANAALLGWLPLIAVNAVFARRVPTVLDFGHGVQHHLYDAGQALGLGVVSWLVVRALGLLRLPLVGRALALCALLVLAEHALLEADLESFLERYRKSDVPWHWLFSAIGAIGIVGSFAVGYLTAGTRLRFAGLALGLALAVANHLVLPLVYRGAHFTLSWCAAGLIGMSLWRDLAALRPPRNLRRGLAAASVLALLTYAVPASAVVRSALLGSSGAVAAPYVIGIWRRFEPEPPVPAHLLASPWFRPRHGLPAIAAQRMPGAPNAPIVILLTVDALRSDLIEGRKVSKDAVPNLLAMRDRSLRFERVWAPAAYTMASLRSLFSGVYYQQQQGRKMEVLRREAGQRAEVPDEPFLAALLDQGGVETLTFRSSRMFSRKGSVCRGFAREKVLRSNYSKDVVRGLLKVLKDEPPKPLFVYAHMMDPHQPYNRGSDKTGTPFERYRSEVSRVDGQIGKLRRELRELGLDRDTYLIVTADHAEAFGEHGHFFHASTVYEEMIRVPLLIEGPGVKPRMARHAVSLIDLGPTILSLFGLPTPGHFMGQSLLPFMHGEDPKLSRPLAVDNGGGKRAMLFEGRWKVIRRSGVEEVFDLQRDPAERQNLVELPQSRVYVATLRAFFAGLVAKAD